MLARRLSKGDTIGVVSPSTPAKAGDVKFDTGVEYLRRMGFKILPGKHVHSESWSYAASPQEKADDLNAMFANPKVKAIICTQGGSTANACLGHLDYDLIRRNPKILLGISDITVLLNAIYTQTGLVTFHGNDVMWGFGNNPAPYDMDEFVARLMEAKIGPVTPNGPRQTMRGGMAQGHLLGGNLDCLLKLAGTPYFPDLRASILFLEAFQPTPERCDYQLHQLQHMGLFEQIVGVILGYMDGLENTDSALQVPDVLLQITQQYDFPILKVKDFGHNCPNTTLPVGVKIHLDADHQTYEIVEPCVL